MIGYLDGFLTDSISASGNIQNAGGDLDIKIGVSTFGIGFMDPTQFFGGAVDDVRIYADALSAELILDHASGDYSGDNAGCEGVCDLRGSWNFDDQGSGCTVNDMSSNDNKGTITPGDGDNCDDKWITP